jgi:hypothetical protein
MYRIAWGDVVAMRICTDRRVPVRKERKVALDLSAVKTRGAAVKATTVVLQAVADGEIAPAEAGSRAKLIGLHAAAPDDAEREASFISLFPGFDFSHRRPESAK